MIVQYILDRVFSEKKRRTRYSSRFENNPTPINCIGGTTRKCEII